ncbi:hypothetical protein [Promicromonospora aerolata]|uniref:Uncharacterized protein n=1 Tax=Promicromonospora aerolata TaxID=195749 RepID=A0ABW4VAC6_9MICO
MRFADTKGGPSPASGRVLPTPSGVLALVREGRPRRPGVADESTAPCPGSRR